MIELHALNASEWLQYSINIEGYGVSACSLDSDCAAGEQCRDDGRCVRASCETDEGCGPGEVCVLGTRLGLNSTGDERQCVPSCESDDDCVNSDGLSCKAVNDGLRRGCLRSGSEPTALVLPFRLYGGLLLWIRRAAIAPLSDVLRLQTGNDVQYGPIMHVWLHRHDVRRSRGHSCRLSNRRTHASASLMMTDFNSFSEVNERFAANRPPPTSPTLVTTIRTMRIH